MKSNKKLKNAFILIILFLSTFILTGCSNKNDFVTATLDDNGDIVIDPKEINSTATFINYEADETIIQFIAVKSEDDTTRLAFNTCQACTPSPKAYFIQEEDYFICQNCGNKFKINEIGIAKGGCNPTPVEEQKNEDNKIIINKNYILEFKEKFESWEGPTE